MRYLLFRSNRCADRPVADASWYKRGADGASFDREVALDYLALVPGATVMVDLEGRTTKIWRHTDLWRIADAHGGSLSGDRAWLSALLAAHEA